MPDFEIETPDGRTITIEAADEATALRGAQEWVAANPRDVKAEADAEVRTGAEQPDFRGGGFFGDWGRRAQRFSDMVTDPLGLQDEIVGAGQAARALVTSGGDLAAAGDAYTKGAERIRAERRVAREDNGYLGTAAEILGGVGASKVATLPTALAPTALETAKQAFKAGAGTGAFTGATNAEGGALERAEGAMIGGAIGGVAGPLISNVAVPLVSRGVAAGNAALNYGKTALQGAQNPRQAAIDAVADQTLDAELPIAAIRARVQPPTSRQLQQAGLTDQDLADIISRQANGESAASVASTYGITDATARKYFQRYRANNPTPVTLLDIAAEEKGYQGAMPLLRRARANNAIAPDSNVLAKLETRQGEQAGRVADILQKSKILGDDGVERELDDAVLHLAGQAKAEERAAYALVHQQQQDISLGGVLRKWQGRLAERHGRVAKGLQEAVDAFKEKAMVEGRGSAPMNMLRLQEAKEKLAKMQSEGADYAKVSRQRRLVRTMEAQEDFTNPLVAKRIKPVMTVQKFLDAREEIDQLVKNSLDQFGKPTPLTAALTELRTELNGAARASNKHLAAADARFHDNRTTEELVRQGQKLATGLNTRTREQMREFSSLTPTQQEVLRTSFEQALANKALTTTDGNNAARAFQNQGFRNIIEAFYPPSAGARIYERGQTMLRNLKRESISSTVANFATNSKNSPTALILQDVDEGMADVNAAADLATGGWTKLRENLSKRLARQIGSRAAGAQMQIVAETDPAKLLPLLNELEASIAARAVKSPSGQMVAPKELVMQLRQLRAMNQPGVAGQAGLQLGELGSPQQ